MWHAPSAQDKSYMDQKPICQPNPMMPAWQLTVPAFLRGLVTTELGKVPSERWRVHSRTPSVACCLCLSQPESLLPTQGEEVILNSSLQAIRGDTSEDFVPFRGHKVLTVMAREEINKLSFSPRPWRMGKSSYFRGQRAWSHL